VAGGGASVALAAPRTPAIAVTPDTTTVAPGQTLQVTVPTPTDGIALVLAAWPRPAGNGGLEEIPPPGPRRSR
jgi:multidrug efflux pump subunit AcrA (membrane-fusion protein)